MKIFSRLFGGDRRSLLWIAVGALFVCSAWSEEIKVGGTGSALGTMRLLGAAFTQKNKSIQVTVLDSLGSSGAIKAVPKSALDVGLASRQLSDDERKDNLVATEYARTLTVFAVSTKSTVTDITQAQIADIYSGRMTQWPDGTRVRLVLRQPGDDSTKQVRGLSPAIDKALGLAEQRPGQAFAVVDQEAADKIESIPGALGFSTLALIKSERRALRALKLDNVDPNIKTGAAGEYPLVKRHYIITKTTPSAATQQFVAFVMSPAGREILTQTGHWFP